MPEVAYKMKVCRIGKPASLIAGVAWLMLCCWGSAALFRHAVLPGTASAATTITASIPTLGNAPTIVMFLHPQCPCSRASVENLGSALRQSSDAFSTYIVFEGPENATPLRSMVSALRGSAVLNDHDGSVARQFDAHVSGQLFAFDRSGRLRFSGGMTSTRGHAGDSDAIRALIDLAHDRQPLTDRTPVFGCNLE